MTQRIQWKNTKWKQWLYLRGTTETVVIFRVHFIW